MLRFACASGCILAVLSSAAMAADPSTRLQLLSNEEAWSKLPGAPKASETLPAWARCLAGWQPITTARMLELDALHRTGERLDGRLRAIVRYAAADANRCEYTKSLACADFDRATGSKSDLAGLMKRPEKLPEADRLAAAFARQMMLEAHAVKDGDVQKLIELLGEERVVALVALLAHASFQDRIVLALNVSPEAEGVPPPVRAKFDRPKAKPHGAPPGPPPPLSGKDEAPVAWVETRKALDKQKERKGRIAVPSNEAVLARIGKDHPALWQSGIIWSRVGYGYQPILTDGFFDCVSAFRQEGELDTVFTNKLFWVVTDALDCFY